MAMVARHRHPVDCRRGDACHLAGPGGDLRHLQRDPPFRHLRGAPSTAFPPNARLTAVSASSTANAFAVGYLDDGRQLIEHWDGSVWRPMAAPFLGFGLP